MPKFRFCSCITDPVITNFVQKRKMRVSKRAMWVCKKAIELIFCDYKIVIAMGDKKQRVRLHVKNNRKAILNKSKGNA